METEENIKSVLIKHLEDDTRRGEFWRGYCEALADVLQIKINEI